MDGSARAGGEAGQGRMVTAWDGHTASAEAAVPACSVRVIKALDCSSGQYIVKQGVSACGRMRRARPRLACARARLRVISHTAARGTLRGRGLCVLVCCVLARSAPRTRRARGQETRTSPDAMCCRGRLRAAYARGCAQPWPRAAPRTLSTPCPCVGGLVTHVCVCLWVQDDVRMWLEKFGPPEVTQTTWRLHKSKIDPCLQCRHHPRSFPPLSRPCPHTKARTHTHTYLHTRTHSHFPVSPSHPFSPPFPRLSLSASLPLSLGHVRVAVAPVTVLLCACACARAACSQLCSPETWETPARRAACPRRG
jgi:hypothetical protein